MQKPKMVQFAAMSVRYMLKMDQSKNPALELAVVACTMSSKISAPITLWKAYLPFLPKDKSSLRGEYLRERANKV